MSLQSALHALQSVMPALQSALPAFRRILPALQSAGCPGTLCPRSGARFLRFSRSMF